MGDYYYNEKKGRYEPVSEAPFGIKPKEKSSKKVFTADDFSQKKTEDFSQNYNSTVDDQRYRSFTDPVEKVVNRLADAISDAANNTSNSGTSNTNQKSTYTSKTTSGTNSGKTTTPKNKVGLGFIIGIIWFIVIAMKSCFE